MRDVILGFALTGALATPAHAERFAISCSGTAVTTLVREGRSETKPTETLTDILYVIDTDAKTVHRLIPQQNLLDRVCSAEGLVCTSNFATTQITIDGVRDSDGRQATIGFIFDRQRNTVESSFAASFGSASGSSLWKMACVPAQIPAL